MRAGISTKKALAVTMLLFITGIVIYPAHRAMQLSREAEALAGPHAQLSTQIEVRQREFAQATQKLAAANEEIARLESGQCTNELLRLQAQAGVLRQQVAVIKSQLRKGSPPQPTIYTDPTLRDYISQMALMEIKGVFSTLFKELKLTPEQARKATEALARLAQDCRDTMYHLPQGSLSPGQISQANTELRARCKDLLLPILGEPGYERFCAFREEIPAQATMEMLNNRLGAQRLTDEQNSRLFQVVRAEPYELMRGIYGWDPAFWGPQEHIDSHLSQITQSNQHILDQAANILTPEQLGALNNVLSNGINTRITEAAASTRKP